VGKGGDGKVLLHSSTAAMLDERVVGGGGHYNLLHSSGAAIAHGAALLDKKLRMASTAKPTSN
jgi:hypothetical protein